MRLQKIFPRAEFFVKIEAKPWTDNILRQFLNMLFIELSVCLRFGDLCINRVSHPSCHPPKKQSPSHGGSSWTLFFFFTSCLGLCFFGGGKKDGTPCTIVCNRPHCKQCSIPPEDKLWWSADGAQRLGVSSVCLRWATFSSSCMTDLSLSQQGKTHRAQWGSRKCSLEQSSLLRLRQKHAQTISWGSPWTICSPNMSAT